MDYEFLNGVCGSSCVLQPPDSPDAYDNRVAQSMVRDGRIVWTSLEVRARLPVDPDRSNRWKICKPDVFSIRNSSRQEYLEPIVHEIKVSRADLLGDLKRQDKREAYLDVGGQCWYVLGCDRRGRSIADADEVPVTRGVMESANNKLVVVRPVPKRAVRQLPFGIWMALAKAVPVQACSLTEGGVGDQAPLRIAQHPCWQEQNGLDQGQHRANRDPDQSQGYRDQPDDGPDHQCKNRNRPAQHEQNEPSQQGQK